MSRLDELLKQQAENPAPPADADVEGTEAATAAAEPSQSTMSQINALAAGALKNNSAAAWVRALDKIAALSRG